MVHAQCPHHVYIPAKVIKSVSAYFLTTDEAIITKLDRNVKQVKIYTNFKFEG